LKKIRCYFDRQSPENLQHEIYFIIVYYLGLRGREWIRRLERKRLIFRTDSLGNEYAIIEGVEAMQKNEQPTLGQHSQSIKDGRIYATDNPDTCPVAALKLYLKKLPEECDHLFYKRVSDWSKTSDYWYNPKMPMGVNVIGSLMKTISKAAGLSKEYTGHCIRSSVVTNLFNKGIAIDEIACVTGHKESNSVKRYLRHVSDEKKISYATALNSSFNDEASSSTVCTADNHDCKYSQYLFLEFITYNNNILPFSRHLSRTSNEKNGD